MQQQLTLIERLRSRYRYFRDSEYILESDPYLRQWYLRYFRVQIMIIELEYHELGGEG